MSANLERLYVPVAIVVLAIAVFVSANGSVDAKTISTSGQASTKVSPDEARISLGVETNGATAQEAQDENVQIANRIMDAISSFDIPLKDIQTTQLTVQPVKEFSPQTGEFIDRGFKATNIITVTTSNFDVLGKLIDATVGAGANRIDDVSFSLRSETEREIRKQLFDEAAIEAKNKAESIASGLGTWVIGVKSASESSFFITPLVARAAEISVKDSTPVSPGQVEVSVSVSVAFSIV